LLSLKIFREIPIITASEYIKKILTGEVL